MGTLIKMKAEVVNPELPVLTEQGILPYYTGVYVNRLAEKGVTLTQTEINAVTAFVSSLIDADLIDKIGAFYPFMGNVNVPLIGNKELEFSNVTSANINLDFVGGKLRGVKSWQKMENIKFSDVANTDFGVFFGGSLLSKTQSGASGVFKVVAFENGNNGLPSLQLRLSSGNSYRFAIRDFYDVNDENVYAEQAFNPALDASSNLHNYSFAYGLTNVVPPYESGFLSYNRTLKRDGVVLANKAGNDSTAYVHSNLSSFWLSGTAAAYDAVLTTFGVFNEILDRNSSKAFVDALDTFTAAVGKTVSVG